MSGANEGKGQAAEESLRRYFQSLGFFVVRGLPFRFHDYDITDVDLWLYIKKSSVTRERINVDIKRKKTPQAMERIFWAKGLREVLGLDQCMVATTDKRPETKEFGELHNVVVLDGDFLSRVLANYLPQAGTLSEAELIVKLHAPCVVDTKISWARLYVLCKQDLVANLDYNGVNRLLNRTKIGIEEYLATHATSESAIRVLYISTAYLLLAIDFKSKHLGYLEAEERKRALAEGFRYGEAGKRRAEEILNTAMALAENTMKQDLFTKGTLRNELERQLVNYPAESLAGYFAKADVMKSLFELAKDFHNRAFLAQIQHPRELESPLKSVLALLADHWGFDRKQLL